MISINANDVYILLIEEKNLYLHVTVDSKRMKIFPDYDHIKAIYIDSSYV